jgi:hypothetical protein
VEDNTLRLEYDGVSDKDTYLNFTNHVYFNLGAKDNKDIVLEVKADKIGSIIKEGRVLVAEFDGCVCGFASYLAGRRGVVISWPCSRDILENNRMPMRRQFGCGIWARCSDIDGR